MEGFERTVLNSWPTSPIQELSKNLTKKFWQKIGMQSCWRHLDYERKVFNSNLEAYKDHLQSELDSSSIPQIQPVWDNLNLRSKHRFERMTDNYADSNYDWMASLWIQERVNASHMKHEPGKALKQAEDLNIQDFVPSLPELNYVFTSLVHYQATEGAKIPRNYFYSPPRMLCQICSPSRIPRS